MVAQKGKYMVWQFNLGGFPIILQNLHKFSISWYKGI